MDKNIAAILREDARTVWVTLDMAIEPDVPFAGKCYTYVTDMDLYVGDTVVVTTQQGAKMNLARVVRVDDDLNIEPNSDIKYQWVVDRVDMAAYNDNMQRNATIEKSIGTSYRKQMRRAMANQILSDLSDESKAEMQRLLGVK